MDPVTTLVCVAGIAWSGQIALGWLQIRRFNQALMQLGNHGSLRIGRSAGRFKPRVIVALSIAADNRVSGNVVMKGLTVFSRPVTDPRLTGMRIEDIHAATLFPRSRSLRQALTLAIAN